MSKNSVEMATVNVTVSKGERTLRLVVSRRRGDDRQPVPNLVVPPMLSTLISIVNHMYVNFITLFDVATSVIFIVQI